jgi:hypothetical protein
MGMGAGYPEICTCKRDDNIRQYFLIIASRIITRGLKQPTRKAAAFLRQSCGNMTHHFFLSIGIVTLLWKIGVKAPNAAKKHAINKKKSISNIPANIFRCSTAPFVIAGPLLPAGSALLLGTGSESAAAAAAIDADPIPCTPPNAPPPPIDAGAVDAIDTVLEAMGPATPPARTLFTSSPRMPWLAGAALGWNGN